MMQASGQGKADSSHPCNHRFSALSVSPFRSFLFSRADKHVRQAIARHYRIWVAVNIGPFDGRRAFSQQERSATPPSRKTRSSSFFPPGEKPACTSFPATDGGGGRIDSLTGQEEHNRETPFRRLFPVSAKNIILRIYHLLAEKTRLHIPSRHVFVRNMGESAASVFFPTTASFWLAEPCRVYLTVMGESHDTPQPGGMLTYSTAMLSTYS